MSKFNILKRLFNSKFVFTKPKQKKVLIYDREREHFCKIFFSNKSYEFLDSRYESINIYVIFYTLFKSGFINFKDSYKKYYIDLVSPKIVFSAIDNSPSFYNLKNLNNKPLYISFQYGMRDNQFYNECKNYIKKTKKKLKADYIFLFGENEKKRFSKIIEGKIYGYGNATNNYYYLKKNKNQNKIDSIMYVSIYNATTSTFDQDKKIFNFLIDFCKKRKIRLSFCSKFDSTKEDFFRKNLKKSNWIYLPHVNSTKTYSNLNKQKMVVFTYSTLGFEALAKGLRCAAFYKNFPIHGNYTRYPKSGVFWSNSSKYIDIEKTLNRVINFSDKKWKNVVKKYSSEILNYDPGNIKTKIALNNILKN